MTSDYTARSVMTLDDARERGAIHIEEAAQLLGIGRGTAYAQASLGTIPTVRIGRRLLVPVPALLRLLGEE